MKARSAAPSAFRSAADDVEGVGEVEPLAERELAGPVVDGEGEAQVRAIEGGGGQVQVAVAVHVDGDKPRQKIELKALLVDLGHGAEGAVAGVEVDPDVPEFLADGHVGEPSPLKSATTGRLGESSSPPEKG